MRFFSSYRRLERALDLLKEGAHEAARTMAGRNAPMLALAGSMPSLPPVLMSADKVEAIEKRVMASAQPQTLGKLVDITQLIGPLPEAPLTEDQIERVERKILTALLHEPDSNVLRPAAFQRKSVTVGIRRSLAAAMAAAMVLGGSAIASESAKPGGITYPIKLQLEAVRLAFAGSPAEKARVHLAIAEERMQELTEIDGQSAPWLVVATLGHLDSSTIAAFENLKEAGSSERTDGLTDLSRFLTREETFLATLLSRTAPSATPKVIESLALARQLSDSIQPMVPAGAPSVRSDAGTSAAKAPPLAKVGTGAGAPGQAPEQGVSQPDPADAGPDDPGNDTGAPQDHCVVPETGGPTDGLRETICNG